MVKNLPADVGNARDEGSIAGSRKSPGGGNGNLLHCSCLGDSIDRGARLDTAHGSQSQARLSVHVHAHVHAHAHTHTPMSQQCFTHTYPKK